MKVLQLIDSLRPGGAEQMAVNIANSLISKSYKSFICCTRLEGLLKNKINPEVEFLSLNKKNVLDLKAIGKLHIYIKKHKIDIIHAHSNSFFLGVLLKLSGLKIKLIWHDHYGQSENLENRNFSILKICSYFFDGIISVNTNLQNWAQEKLYCKKIILLKNYINSSSLNSGNLPLKGNGSFRIICVANLRPQKDHLNLLQAFEMLPFTDNISLHLVGTDFNNKYSADVFNFIKQSKKKDCIFFYDSIANVFPLLLQADLGVLSSKSEGLPLALLEYGLAGLNVVCTDVGKCKEVIGENGLVIPPGIPIKLKHAILKILRDSRYKNRNISLQKKIKENYTEEAVLPDLLKFYKELNEH